MVELPEIGPEDLPEWALYVFGAAEVLTALLGIAIAYIAYRGYRRNQSRPMLYLAIGFVLVLGIPFVMFIFQTFIPIIPALVFVGAMQLSQVAGLVVILYALWM